MNASSYLLSPSFVLSPDCLDRGHQSPFLPHALGAENEKEKKVG